MCSKLYHMNYQALRKATLKVQAKTIYFTTQEVVNKAPSNKQQR